MGKYTERDLELQLKPYSKNPLAAFFQKIWRGWLSAWYGFADRHPKLSNIIYMVFFFVVFSYGVTIWQLLVMLFLPQAFSSLSGTFAWPMVRMGDMTWTEPIFEAGKLTGGFHENVPVYFSIFGDSAGLGNWLAFEIAVFTAQCINFPLQRNITYRSHGNPWYQAMWYFIGWVGVSFLTGIVWGAIDPLLKSAGWYYVVNSEGVLVENGALYFLATLIKTVITGGVSMFIFFFIFLVIFPNNDKVAAKTKAKYEKALAANASAEKVEKARAAWRKAQDRADRSNAEKAYSQAVTQANSKALKYFATIKKIAEAEKNTAAAGEALEEAKRRGDAAETARKVMAYAEAEWTELDLKARVKTYFKAAGDAIDRKEAAKAEYLSVMERLGLPAKI